MIGYDLVRLHLVSSKKSEKGRISCSTGIEIKTLDVSPEFANSVSGSGLQAHFSALLL